MTGGSEALIIAGYNDRIRHDVIPLVPRTTGTLLDVGGGSGATAVHLKRAGYASKAGTVDIAAGDDTAPDLDFQMQGDLDDPHFVERVLAEQGPFDTILCLDVLEHLADPWRLVAQLHRGLCPGGTIVASIPNVRHYRVSGSLFLRNRWALQEAGVLDRTHLRFFVRDTAIELMTHSGLTLEEIRPSPLAARSPERVAWFRRLTFGKLDSFVTVDYLLRVRRADELPLRGEHGTVTTERPA